MKIILASGSPRRRELLALAGVDFEVAVSDADENVSESLAPSLAAMELSQRKAMAVARMEKYRGSVVLGADTIVSLDGRRFGKPKDDEDAFNMLSALSDRTHTVYTGVTIVRGDMSVNKFVESTEVHFYPLSDAQIRTYIATGEGRDKAGAYGIQGRGAVFISGIIGDYYNVMGLPIGRIMQQLYGIIGE